MTEQLDAQGEAHAALNSAVADFSKRVLSDPRLLGNVVGDYLPDWPRERDLLVTAAQADVAGELTRNVEQQHLDPDTAVQLVARSLSDRKAIDSTASIWVTTEYAKALGYPVRAAASPTQPPRVLRSITDEAETKLGPPDGSTVVPTPPSPGKSNRGLIYGVGAGVGVVIIFIAVAFGAGLFKSSPKVTPTPTPHVSPTHHPTPVTSSTGPVTLASGVAPVSQLLPADLSDISMDCTPASKIPWSMPGLVTALDCRDPNLPTGSLVDAYQVNNAANFQTSWHNFNQFLGFSVGDAGNTCPPGSSGYGTFPFHNNYFPGGVNGQVLECEAVSTSSGVQPTYTWAYPTEDAFIIAQLPANASFTTLSQWWLSTGGPGATPSPAP
jgi:hypothetical protein